MTRHAFSAVLAVALLAACEPEPAGTTPDPGPTTQPGTATGTGTGTGTPTGTTSTTGTPAGTGSTPRPTSCLDIGTLTMDMQFAWDNTAGEVVPLVDPTSGATIPPTFRMNFGPVGWTGDTSQPGPPNNWCYVEWDLTGSVDLNVGATSWLDIGDLDLLPAETNCDQPTTPGAGDRVWLCAISVGYGTDFIDTYSTPDWTFQVGGVPIDAQLAGFPAYFTPYGYLESEFWGGELYNAGLFGPDPIGTIGYTIDDPTVPTRFDVANIPVGDAAVSGQYVHMIPWVFTFN